MTGRQTKQIKFIGMPLNIWALLLLEYAVFAGILFGGAGTWDWMAGWVFMGLMVSSQTLMSLLLAKHDPDLLAERARVLPQKNQPTWDRIILLLLGALILLWLLISGLDAVRLGWSDMPDLLRGLGAIVMVASLWAVYFVMRQNSYVAPTVRTQKERGRIVVSTGAYARIRHPFYAALIPFFLGGSLLLGSWMSVIGAGLITVTLVYRCVKEEMYLAGTLDGYAGYMKKVPYRLIPYIW